MTQKEAKKRAYRICADLVYDKIQEMENWFDEELSSEDYDKLIVEMNKIYENLDDNADYTQNELNALEYEEQRKREIAQTISDDEYYSS